MALVAYDNSDSSSYEDDESQNSIEIKKAIVAPLEQNIENGESDTEHGKSLFNQLPQPSSKNSVVLEDDDEFLHKKEPQPEVKPKSKITVPSLNDFKDVDVTIPSSKSKSNSGKKSGLLSMLPQPKNSIISTTRSLIPNVVAQKPQTNTAKKKDEPFPVRVTKVESKALVNDYSDESDNDEVQNDFFSINKPVELPEEDSLMPVEELIQNEKKKPRSIESYFKKDTKHVELQQDYEDPAVSESYDTQAESLENSNFIKIENSNNEMVLDDEAILKLVGARGKRKREEIQIVDVNQQEVLTEAREMLLKGLMEDTTKRQSASKKRGNEPTNMQKRKHQITYLAHQAKANEAELQNQWANSRMTKRKTQSKYGF